MTITLPVEAASLVGKTREANLIFLSFVQQLIKRYGRSEFVIYKYDFCVLMDCSANFSPHDKAQDIMKLVRLKWSGDYTINVTDKEWGGQTFQYKVQDTMNVMRYCFALDRLGLEKRGDEIRNVSATIRDNKFYRTIQALKNHIDKVHDR